MVCCGAAEAVGRYCPSAEERGACSLGHGGGCKAGQDGAGTGSWVVVVLVAVGWRR